MITKKTWEPHDMPGVPFTIYPTLESGTKTAKKILGYGYSTLTCFFNGEKARWGYAEEEMQELGKYLADNPQEVIKLSHSWQQYLADFKNVCKRINKLEALSDREIIKLFDKFYRAYVEQYSIPLLANSFDFYFQKWLKARVKDTEDYLWLTSSSKESFIRKEIRELLAIKKDRNFLLSIEKHAQKYFWLENNYAKTKVLGKEHFIKKYNQESYNKFERVNKKQLLGKYGIAEELINVAEECIYWRDERKKYNLIGNHFLLLFLKEFSGRRKISFNDMKFILPPELENHDLTKIDKRKNGFLIIMTAKSEEIFIGEKAFEMNKKMYPSDSTGKDFLQGITACLGKTKGRVKVIMDESDFSKFKEKEILVTSMTRPEFVPLMKKAAGIVTDEGGITCHAAVVSRELKKPCLIATKTATKIFRDGDLVELDTEKGIIRRV